MIPIFISIDTAKTLRRQAFGMMQILRLEHDKHCIKFPGYLQDKEYLEVLQKQMDEQVEIFNACSESLSGGIHVQIKAGGGQ